MKHLYSSTIHILSQLATKALFYALDRQFLYGNAAAFADL